MALTPEQIQKLRSDAGLNPNIQQQSSGPSQDLVQKRLAEFDSIVNPKTNIEKVTDTLGKVGVGVAKGALSTIKGAGELGTKIGNAILPKSLEIPDTYSTEALAKDAAKGGFQGRLLSPENTTAQGTAEKIGKGVEQVAEYLVPASKVGSVEKGASLATKAINIGSKALTSGAVASTQAGEVGKDAAIAAGTEVALPVIGETVARPIGRAISKLGGKLVEAVIPTSAKEAQILQSYKAGKPFLERIGDMLKGSEDAPVTAGKTVTTQGLMGTKTGIGIQAKRASQNLWNDVISPRLKAASQRVDLEGFFSKIESDIIDNNPELSRRKSLLEALDSVKEDYDGVHQISLEKLQKLKEGWAKFVPDKAYKGKPIAGAFNEVRNSLAGEARNTIYSTLGDDVKQAYFDYGNLKGLEEYGQNAMTGSKLKGGAGSLISEIASKAVTPIGTIAGQAVYRLGNGIEVVGAPGATKLGQVLGIGKYAAINATQNLSSKD